MRYDRHHPNIDWCPRGPGKVYRPLHEATVKRLPSPDITLRADLKYGVNYKQYMSSGDETWSFSCDNTPVTTQPPHTLGFTKHYIYDKEWVNYDMRIFLEFIVKYEFLKR